MAKLTAIILDWQKMSRDERNDVAYGDHKTDVARAVLARGAFVTYEVEAQNREDVFAKLNHGSGCEDPGYHGRSLSCGDIVVEQGKMWLCAAVGWVEVPAVANIVPGVVA